MIDQIPGRSLEIPGQHYAESKRNSPEHSEEVDLQIGRPGGIYAEGPKDWEQFAVILGHPLIWLFFGGFVLAAGLSKTSLDRQLASRILLPSAIVPGGSCSV